MLGAITFPHLLLHVLHLVVLLRSCERGCACNLRSFILIIAGHHFTHHGCSDGLLLGHVEYLEFAVHVFKL